MKLPLHTFRFAVLFVFALLTCATLTHAAPTARPNFLVILADDLGYSDLSCYGGEIATPNLDTLADNGLRYTQFYNTSRCWPTRAALLTGYYPQQVGFDALPNVPNKRQRPKWSRLLPEYLRPLGYRSYHSGKWHVDGGPVEGGFDRSYSLNDQDRFFSPQKHTLDDEPLPPVERNTDYYATTEIANRAIQFLKQHASQHADQPFFSYVAFTSPHFPLHALPRDIERYKETYHVGWDKVRDRRWQRIESLLHLPGELSPLEPSIGPPYGFVRTHKILGPREVYRETPWADLSNEQREYQAAKMATHAAMVDRMDQEIGRLLKQLRDMNALDNTVVMFLADNGASAEVMVRGDGYNADAPPGSADAFLCLGPGWSRAANTPFRRHKTWTHEGGISTPFIVLWPAGVPAQGELRNTVGHVIDISPTILSLAGGKWPDEYDGKPLPPAAGRDLSSSFPKDSNTSRELYWLHEDNRAIRSGNWKLVSTKGAPWELYDLAKDRTETQDLAVKNPEKVRELADRWQSLTTEFEALATQASD
jgi:arylsulfatase A-like enzyme